MLGACHLDVCVHNINNLATDPIKHKQAKPTK